MKTSLYLILITWVLALIVPVSRYFTVDPNVNACMIDYVKTLDGYNKKWYMYSIDGLNHIEPKKSIYNDYLGQYKIGYTHGCIMASGRLFTDFNNSVYCSVTYIITRFWWPYQEFFDLDKDQKLAVLGDFKDDFGRVFKESLN